MQCNTTWVLLCFYENVYIKVFEMKLGTSTQGASNFLSFWCLAFMHSIIFNSHKKVFNLLVALHAVVQLHHRLGLSHTYDCNHGQRELLFQFQKRRSGSFVEDYLQIEI